jgi:hypothetical protein
MMESIKDVKVLNGVTKVMTNDERPKKEDGSVDWEAFDVMREEFPVCVDHEKDMVSFKLMTKPVKEGGKGCQHTDLVALAKHIVEYFHAIETNKIKELERALKEKSFSSNEESEELRSRLNGMKTSFDCNQKTIQALATALHFQSVRTADRDLRGVEGTYKE